MNDFYQQAREYFLAIETNRISAWWRWSLRLLTAFCVAGFFWKLSLFFRTLFHPRLAIKPHWLDFDLAIGCEIGAGICLCLSAWWNRQAFVRHYQAQWPENKLRDAREVKTRLLEKLLGCPSDQFFGWYKELAARRQAVQANRCASGLNSRRLLALIYDPEGKARIWTLSSVLVSAFIALVAAKLAEPEDFVSLMTAQGFEYLKLSLFVVFFMVLSTLFVIYTLLDLAQGILAWTFSHFTRWNIGRDDVLDYLLRDMLRFERTKLPGLAPDETATPSTAMPSSVAEAADACADPTDSKEDHSSGLNCLSE